MKQKERKKNSKTDEERECCWLYHSLDDFLLISTGKNENLSSFRLNFFLEIGNQS